MSRARSVLVILLATACCASAIQSRRSADVRLFFVGDILLSRQVSVEIKAAQRSPWSKLMSVFREADWIGGNLEGSVGSADDCKEKNPCFTINPDSIKLLKQAGFQAISVENNHAGDTGEKGRIETVNALIQNMIYPASLDNSPSFFRFKELTIGLVNLSMVAARDGRKSEIPSIECSQKIRLARSLSNLVIVSIHWGSEFLNWPSLEQRKQAQWLIAQGADIIIGHHPHVVQPLEMIDGKPVYFSLGNHLFDQRFPETKQGMIADIRISGGMVYSRGISTEAPRGSSFPEIIKRETKDFEFHLPDLPAISGHILRPRPSVLGAEQGIIFEEIQNNRVSWVSRPLPVVTLARGHLAGPNAPELLFALQRHHSSIDGETGLRPYVYEIGPAGLIARWRGSALAWPLLDAALLPENDEVICGLHRGDSFITLDPMNSSRRVAAYKWNGFGFSGIGDSGIIQSCRKLFSDR